MLKFKQILLLAAGLTLVCAAAMADIGPPVTIKLSSELKPAVAGQEYTGRLMITTHAPVTMDNFRIEGRSWKQGKVQQLDIQNAEKSAAHEITFSAVPDDPDRPLIILFDVAGQTVRKELDLSPRNIERAFKPAPTRAAPPVLPSPYHSSDHYGLEPETSVAPEKNAASVVHITGRFSYLRPDGVRDMARSMLVQVYDEDYDMDADDLLASWYTDEYGYYDFWFDTTNDDPADIADIVVVFKATNEKVYVRNPTTDQIYAYSSITYYDFTGSELNLGHLEPEADEYPGLFLYNSTTRAYLWCIQQSGYEMPPVDIYWPEGDSGAWYTLGTNDIHVSTAREWNDGTIGHEYGHFWENTFSIQEPLYYCNTGWWCDTNGCGHCLWCRENPVVAWVEGWAQFFTMAYTNDLGALFAIDALEPRDFEVLQQCGTDGFHDPEITEGFCAAMLQDIYDENFENDPQYPDWSDWASLGLDEIFTVVDLDDPTSPSSFLDAFIARYPLYKEGIWQTAANNGYDPDGYYPGIVTGLTSYSHDKTGDSADPTIDFTWVAAEDDASGIAGHGISISFSPEMPGEVMDIGPETAYTTPPLDPGTYWFNIRPVDRAGHWCQYYSTYGPVTIRAAEEVDLAWYDSPNWPYPLVPSDVTTNTSTSCPVPATLTGGTTATYWNVRGINNGDAAATGFHVGLNVDGQSKAGLTFALANGGGGQYYSTNRGPLFFEGGRHTIGAFHDDLNAFAEPSETNNVWAHQFVWTGSDMILNETYGLEPPPASNGGWEDVVDGQTKYYNCFGQEFSSTGYWHAVSLKALEQDENYELRLHLASTGAQNGYAANLAYSARGAGFLDAVLINTNTTGYLDYNIGVLNHYGSSDIYTTELVRETIHAFGDSLTYTMGAGHQLRMFEFRVNTADTGQVSIVVESDPADGPLKVLWLDENFTYGTLYSYDAYSAQDEYGRARIDVVIPEYGYNCVVVYREPIDGNTAQDFTLEIQTTAPDLRVVYEPGWDSPLVPRPTPDGTDPLVARPDTLHGVHDGATYINCAIMNDSPTVANAPRWDIDLDGELWLRLSNAYRPAYSVSLFNSTLAQNVRGGRHTMDVECDPEQTMEEISENNNIYGEQWVWGPEPMAVGASSTRLSPPNAYGGWSKVTTSAGVYYNCDGMRIPATHNWHAMAVAPINETDRIALRMHRPVSGVSGGFGPNVAYSNWAAGNSDFVLVNFNQTPPMEMDIGVLDFDDGGNYQAHSVAASWLDADPTGTYGPYVLGAGAILSLHELSFTTAGPQAILLESTSGTVDWGMTLYGEDVTYAAKSAALPGGSSWLAGEGADELMIVDIPAPGSLCLAVWKVGSTDLDVAGTYQLTVQSGATPVGDDGGLPRLTRLAAAQPNPFNPSTTLSFDLARPEMVILEVYDLQGRLVRSLLHESRTAGTHSVRWNGLDNGGRQVASNVYLARFQAGAINESRKLVLLK
jgi:hypothetical protein